MLKRVRVIADMDMGNGVIKETTVVDWSADEAAGHKLKFEWNKDIEPRFEEGKENAVGFTDKGQSIKINYDYPAKEV